MRTLFLTDSDVWAGTERHMLDLAIPLRERGVEITFSGPLGALEQQAKDADFRYLSIPKRGLFDRRAVSRLARYIRRHRIEVVHAHNGRMQLHGALAILLAGRGQLVFTQHFIDPHHATANGIKGAIFGAVHGFVNARTARVVAISEAVRAAMLSRGELASQKITVVPNGIANPDIQVLKDRTEVRGQFAIEADAKLIVCVARLEKEKSISTLLEAFEMLPPNAGNVHLLIAGQGNLRQDLEAEAVQRGLTGRVQLVGFVEDALSLINAADLFVLPSPDEPFGLVFLEAMACGKPIIACAGGAAPEIVEHETTGLLVPPRDAAAMAQAMERLVCEPQLAAEYGEAGRARFLANYTRELMADRMRKLYDEVLTG